MRNVWMVPVFAVLLMGFGRCEWWPPRGGGGDDDECKRDRECAGAGMCVDGTCECSGIAVLCIEGTIFDDDPNVCACVPQGETTFCGGIAGIPCPGAGMCVDDPSDDCDLDNGGADCGGLCECNAAAISCPTGTWLNDDPAVCDCIPNEGEPCGPTTCGEGLVCCNESCGICTEPGGSCTEQFCEDPAPECAGFLGLTCPGEGECVDDPSDDCDPENGGADCSGLCECNVGPVIDCQPGSTFDDSPSVCACLPATGGEPCGDVTCGEGLVCCNASCGICTEPDGVCIQIACE
jgi:hypothetical protein